MPPVFLSVNKVFSEVLNLSLKKIIALIICISFISGTVSLAFANSNTQNKAIGYSQTADKTDQSENKISEKTQDDKIDYLASQFSTSLNLISNQYYLEIINSISSLSHPLFLPPKL